MCQSVQYIVLNAAAALAPVFHARRRGSGLSASQIEVLVQCSVVLPVASSAAEQSPLPPQASASPPRGAWPPRGRAHRLVDPGKGGQRPRNGFLTPGTIVAMSDSYRWTVRGVDPDLAKELRIAAFKQDRTLADVVNEALRSYLDDLELLEAKLARR